MREKWFVEFERETSEKHSEISKSEGEMKRKRGRPRKHLGVIRTKQRTKSQTKVNKQ